MGNLFTFLKRNKNTKEKLEDIQNEIDRIEEYKLYVGVKRKNYSALLYLFSVIIFLSGWGYFFFTCERLLDLLRNLTFICFNVLSPIILYFTRKWLHKYFKWRMEVNNVMLGSLLKQKRKIISKVQETETFNDAKIILEKYDPSALCNLSMSLTNLSTIGGSSSSGSNVRYRPRFSSINTAAETPKPRPLQAQSTPTPNLSNLMSSVPQQPAGGTPRQTQFGARTVKPILPQNRSVVEKFVDYMFSDGPSNRFALICSKCSSHNGMALPDEFEYISYICAYCAHFNAARKMKPTAPTIETFKAIEAAPSGDKSDSESTSDESKKPQVEIIELDSTKADESTNHPVIEEEGSESNSSENTPVKTASLTSSEPEKLTELLKNDSIEFIDAQPNEAAAAAVSD